MVGYRVIILGGGFAGTAVAQTLVRSLPREVECEITLVDRNDFFLFTPMLTEVAGGEVDAADIVPALRSLSPRIVVRQGTVHGIDVAARRVTLAVGGNQRGITPARETLEADHLVIALGSVPNFHHVPGAKENAFTLKTLADAATLRNRALALLARATEEPDPAQRRALLTFVVGGGGSSGVETMASLNDLLRERARHVHGIQADDIRTVIVQPGDRLLPELSTGLAGYAQRELQAHGVDIVLRADIARVDPDHIEITERGGSTRRIPTHTVIWAAGITPNPLIERLGVKLGPHHGIVVDECCQVPGHPGVWALGDNAEVPRPDGKGSYAPTAQNATREGALVARNIAAVMRRQPPQPFTYRPIGELALVGRRSAVASLYGVHFSGLPAWLAWRGIYLAKLPRMPRRVQVGVSWLLDTFVGRDAVQIPGASPSESAE